MKWKWITVACALHWTGSLACAQQPTATPRPLPPGPLLATPPEFSQWTLTVRLLQPSPGGAAGTSAALQSGEPAEPNAVKGRMVMTRTKNILYGQMEYGNGKTGQMWCVNQIQANQVGNKQWSVITGAGGMFKADYGQTPFPYFEWVSAKTYVDVMKIMGRDCLVFKTGRATPETPGQAAQEGAVPVELGNKVACIDLETRLPVSLKRGNELRVYEFRPAPTEMLNPPAELLELLKARQKSIDQNNAQPSRP